MRKLLPTMLLLGCAVENDPMWLEDSDELDVSLELHEPRDGGPTVDEADASPDSEDEEGPCQIEDDPSKPHAVEFAASMHEGPRDGLEVVLDNPLDEPGRYRVAAGIFSQEGTVELPDVLEGEVEGGEHLTLRVDESMLALPDGIDSAKVSLTVLATFSDGYERVMGRPVYATVTRSLDAPPSFDARPHRTDHDIVPLERGLADALRGRDHIARDPSYPHGARLVAAHRQLDIAVVPQLPETFDSLEPDPDAEQLTSEEELARRMPPIAEPVRVVGDPRDAVEPTMDDFEAQLARLRSQGVDLDALAADSPPTGATPMVKFCLELETHYTDAGGGETRWTNPNPQFRDIPGLLLQVQRWYDGAWYTVWMDYTDDGIGAGDSGVGCTDEIPGGGAFFRFTLYSESNVQGNDIDAWDLTGSGPIPMTYSLGQWAYATSGTYDVEVSTEVDEVLNVLAATSYGIYRHAGGLNTADYDIHVGGSNTQFSGGIIQVTDVSSDEKFKILHEVGHAIGSLTTGGVITGSNYSRFANSCPNWGPGDHSLTSYEYQEAAANEGFAHFYAADVFNTHSDNAGCWFGYYKAEWGETVPVWVSCESSSVHGGTTFDNSFYENNCLQNAGRGVELDWLRQFWDVHTNSTSHPGFTEIVNWLDSAAEPSNTNAFTVLNSAAQSWGGSLWSRWNGALPLNGIDH